jgi:predicted phage terminase large subunit-like protein
MSEAARIPSAALDALSSPATFAVKVSHGKWKCAKHLELLNERLLDIASGKIKRLMVLMPPRNGKSELVSKYFPAWYLGLFPDNRIILTSYEADFAAQWGRRARELIEEHGKLQFIEQIEVSGESSAAARWDIVENVDGKAVKRDGGMITAGANGPITGKGAHVAIIDDPIKNREQADSVTYRERNKEWYRSTLYTRLEPDGAIILVMTRWHEDDLAGWLLEEAKNGTGDQWTVLRFPAIAEEEDELGRMPGDPLWPERFPLEVLEKIQAVVGPYDWAALYQARPAPAEGGLFKKEWFEIVDAWPINVAIKVREWDLAGSRKKKADWTSGLLAGLHDGILYVVHLNRIKADPAGVDNEIALQAELDGHDIPIRMEQEPGSAGIHVCDNFARHILLGYDFMGIPSTGSKIERARGVRSMAAMGNVKLLRGPWNQVFLDEVALFPNGRNDDIVDTLSAAHRDLTGDLFRDLKQEPTLKEATAESELDHLVRDMGITLWTDDMELPGL